MDINTAEIGAMTAPRLVPALRLPVSASAVQSITLRPHSAQPTASRALPALSALSGVGCYRLTGPCTTVDPFDNWAVSGSDLVIDATMPMGHGTAVKDAKFSTRLGLNSWSPPV